MGQVIVVEDDAGLREQVVAFLCLSGLDACGVGSAAELYRRMAVEKFAILVLDLRLPDEDGLSIAAYVRSLSDIGIIMVTARNKAEERVRGRQAGADVYLTKPVDLEELAAAIRSLSRRVQSTTESAATEPKCWVLDRSAFHLRSINGRTLELTATDLALFARLTQNWGSVVERGELLKAMGYDPMDRTNRNLDAAIRRLRIKAENAIGEPLPIRTIHAVGYQFTEKVVIED